MAIIEQVYHDETKEKPTYKKEASTYHTLKYVRWLEQNYDRLRKERDELKEALFYAECETKQSEETEKRLEKERDELQAALDYCNQEAECAMDRANKYRTTLCLISEYGKDGICPYGCDTPHIAQQALEDSE